MISRVIDARAEDMRAFVEEAAGISRYKERRKETEARISDTRENLERLQDVVDEVEKQIRHLQRQAATARKYQGLKEQERRLTAELLALRLRDLDSGAEVHDAAVRARELAMQAALAEQRSAEAAIEKQRAIHTEHSEQLSQVQGRYYEVGADISRLEQSIEHTRELRERQRADLAQAHTTLTDLASHMARDEQQLAAVRAELGELSPRLEDALQAEARATAHLESSETALQEAQQRWEAHTQASGAAQQSAHVERARIEQLDNQERRLGAQAQRLAEEHEALSAAHPGSTLEQLQQDEARARAASVALAASLVRAQERVQSLRAEQLAAEGRLEQARTQRESARAELTSLEALQAAALSDHAGQAQQWLEGSGLAARPRLATLLEVEDGWERAVETVLGDYLEAVCVEGLDAVSGALASLATGRVTLVESTAGSTSASADSLAAHVHGPAVTVAALASVRTAQSLAQALRGRSALGSGESLITREGEWVGRDWLRVSRGTDQRAGVLEREQRLKGQRAGAAAAATTVAQAEAALSAARAVLAQVERERDETQAALTSAHRSHADLEAALAGRAPARGGVGRAR